MVKKGRKTMKLKTFMRLWLLAVLLLVVSACTVGNAQEDTRLRIGYGSGFLSSPIYAADYDVNLHYFYETADIVPALIQGSLDAGFLSIDRFVALMESNTKLLDELSIMGT